MPWTLSCPLFTRKDADMQFTMRQRRRSRRRARAAGKLTQRMLSFEELLEKWFSKLHDPTTLNRQGQRQGDAVPLSDLTSVTGAARDRRTGHRARRCLGGLTAADHYQHRARRHVVQCRDVPSRLPAQESERLHLSLHARVASAGLDGRTDRRPPPTAAGTHVAACARLREPRVIDARRHTVASCKNRGRSIIAHPARVALKRKDPIGTFLSWLVSQYLTRHGR